jgi:hypothetical protein
MPTDQTFGPNTAQFERLVARTQAATPEELGRMFLLWLGSMNADRPEMWDRVRPVMNEGPRAATVKAALPVIEKVVPASPQYPWPAQFWQQAAVGVLIQDLIKPADFEAMVYPVASVLGRCWLKSATEPPDGGQTFGPNTSEVQRLLIRLAKVRPDESDALEDAKATVAHPERVAAITRAYAAVDDAGSVKDRYQQWDLVAASVPPWFQDSSAAIHAAFAVTFRGLIDPDDFEVLVNPVVQVFGRCWEEEA